MITWWLFIASSEHGFQSSAVKHDTRDWIHVSPSSETKLEHVHVMMDAADVDSINEASSGRTSDDVSCSYFFISLFIILSSLRHVFCYRHKTAVCHPQ